MAPPHTQSRNFQWQQPAQHGCWERDIDECDRFYKSLSRGEGCYPVTATASFATLPSGEAADSEETPGRIEAALQKAWVMLRWEHPTLGSFIEQDHDSGWWKQRYVSFADAEAQDRWVRSTFKVVDTAGASAHQWFNENSAPIELANLNLVRSRDNKETGGTVFLKCPHDVTDGIGVLQLLSQLFNHAALAYEQGAEYTLPEWGRETARLAPCLRVAAGIPSVLSEAQSIRLEEIQARNGSIYNHPRLLSLPPSSTTSQSKIPRRALSVPKDATQDILRRCKLVDQDVNVTHVFTAALTAALSELQPRGEERYAVRYVNHALINLRPFCPAPYDGPDHAAAACHTVSAQALGVDLFVPGATDDVLLGNALPRVARSVRDFYESIRPLPCAGQHEQILFAPSVFQSLTPPPGTDPHAVSEPPFCPVALSSLGRADNVVAKRHGLFTLTSVSAFSEPMGAGVALFLGSWDGELEISGVFDTRYHDPGYIERFLLRVIACVYAGTGPDDRVPALAEGR